MIENECFTIDVCLSEEWLVNALEAFRKGKLVRVSVVIGNSGPNTTYKARAIGGGEGEYIIAAIAGDFTKEEAWRGDGS